MLAILEYNKTMPDLYDASKGTVKNNMSESLVKPVAETKISGSENEESIALNQGTSQAEADTGQTISVEKLQAKQTIRDFLPRKMGTSLSSLIILPSNKVHFETQDSSEEVLVIVRAHWLTNIPWVLTAVALLLAPKVLAFFPLLDAFPERFQTAFVIGWYLIALMYIFERFLSWFFNLAIITDERIIDVNLNGLTGRKIADAELDKIQDVTFVNSGVFGTVFNYGDVFVQTAAEVVQFVFSDVPRPAKVAEILQKLRIEEKQEAIEGRIR